MPQWQPRHMEAIQPSTLRLRPGTMANPDTLSNRALHPDLTTRGTLPSQ